MLLWLVNIYHFYFKEHNTDLKHECQTQGLDFHVIQQKHQKVKLTSVTKLFRILGQKVEIMLNKKKSTFQQKHYFKKKKVTNLWLYNNILVVLEGKKGLILQKSLFS